MIANMTNKKGWIAGIGFTILLGLAVLFLPGEKHTNKINIGVSDDSASYAFRFLMEKPEVNIKLNEMLGIYPLKNCCTTTSEWALSTDNLDIALICPEAAERLLATDSRYKIIGPFMVNSDILVLRTAGSIKKIGITQNRWYQETLVHKMLGSGIQVHPMLYSALAYAYTDQRLDGVVIDAGKALRVEGKKQSLRYNGDTVTYVLVARKEFIADERFQEFIMLYNQAVEELSNTEKLQEVIEKYAGYPCNGKEAREWQEMNIRYLSLTMPASD